MRSYRTDTEFYGAKRTFYCYRKLILFEHMNISCNPMNPGTLPRKQLGDLTKGEVCQEEQKLQSRKLLTYGMCTCQKVIYIMIVLCDNTYVIIQTN